MTQITQKYEPGGPLGAVGAPAPPRDATIVDFMRVARGRRPIILITMSVCLALSLVATKLMHPKWQAVSQLTLVEHALTGGDTKSDAEVAPVVESIDEQLALIQSDAMAERAIEWLRTDAVAKGQSSESVTITPMQLEKATTVSNPKDTNLLNVAVLGELRESAAELCNAIDQSFVALKTEMARHDVENTAQTLKQRVADAKGAMESAAARLSAFKQSREIVDLDAQERSGLDLAQQQIAQISVLQQQFDADSATAATLGARLAAENKDFINATGVRDDLGVHDLQSQLAVLQQQRDEAALKYRAKYPGQLPVLDKQISDLQAKIKKAINDSISNKTPSLPLQQQDLTNWRTATASVVFDHAKLSAAQAAYQATREHSGALAHLENQYQSLVGASVGATKLFSDLQASLNACLLAKDQINGNVQIAGSGAPFVPEEPFSPRPLINVALGLVAGIVLSFILVLIAEQVDRRVRTIVDIEDFTQVPIIGAIPVGRRSQSMLVENADSPEALSDIYQLAYANLVLSMNAARQRLSRGAILLVTSAVPGEGKSTTAANFATTVARAGKRVVLVDCDMRKSTQSLIFEGGSERGLADVLAGTADITDVVFSSHVPNLMVVHSGSYMGDTAELFLKPKMIETLNLIASHADLVVIDTPACSVVADALFLAPHADIILQVVAIGRVGEDDLEESVRALASTDKQRVCIITHAPESKQKKHYRNYYAKGRVRTTAEDAPELSNGHHGGNVGGALSAVGTGLTWKGKDDKKP